MAIMMSTFQYQSGQKFENSKIEKFLQRKSSGIRKYTTVLC